MTFRKSFVFGGEIRYAIIFNSKIKRKVSPSHFEHSDILHSVVRSGGICDILF